MPPLSPAKKSCLALAIAQSLNLAGAQAATIEVTSTLDDGADCTLREAIENTNAGSDQSNGCFINIADGPLGSNDAIVFGTGVAGGTISLAGSELTIMSSVSINLGGETTTISANSNSRVLAVNDAPNVSLDRLIVADGSTYDPGAGIYIQNSNVSMSNSSISNNFAGDTGGGIYVGQNSSLNIANSTISENLTYGNGSGIYALGGSKTNVVNSTLSSNRAFLNGGGIYAGNGASVTLSNSTLASNLASRGGGIYARGTSNVSLNNSIVAIVSGIGYYNIGDCVREPGFARPVTAGPDNIIHNGFCDTSALSVDPSLGPLAANGGPTQTHALLRGSPAINAGIGVGATAIDQRGIAALGVRDIGAYEANGDALPRDITVTSIADDDGAGCTLREAIANIDSPTDLANGCVSSVITSNNTSIIRFAASVVGNTISLAGSELTLSANVNINPDGQTTTVTANNASRVFAITGSSDASLNNLYITGGRALFGGGITIQDNSYVNLNNSTVSGNSADNSGGGIYVSRSLSYSDSDGHSSISINNSVISGNSASTAGGLAAGPYTVVSASNSNISDNSADSFGGGLLSRNNSTVNLINNTIFRNSASVGGGIYAGSNSSISLSNSTVSNNYAYSGAGEGGGVFANDNSSVSLNNSTISENSAISGGGIFADIGTSVNVSNSTLSENTALSLGGGISQTGLSSSVNLNASTVSDNSANYFGGGIYVEEGNLNLNQSTLSGNSAPNGGGGIFAYNTASVDLTNSTLSANLGDYGGGILAYSNTSLSLINSTLSENSAAIYGGGIFLYDSSARLRNSIIANSSDEECIRTASSSFNSGESNIVSDGTCGARTQVANPRLGPLADNGGPTQTHALLQGSPAINASQGFATTADQRGFAALGVRDIGAFEFSANESDTDGDGLPDGYERANGLDPFDASDRNEDPDGDGFSNFEEFEFGSDPQVADTDNNNNGIPDSVEPPVIAPSLKLLLLRDDE